MATWHKELGKRFAVLLICAVMGWHLAVPLQAEETAQGDSGQWRFLFAPYVWAINLDGEVGMLGQRVDVNVGFLDVYEAADDLTAWISYTEARRDNLWFYLDVIYADLSFSEDAATSFRAFPGFTLTLSADGKLDYEYAIVESGVGHAIAKWHHGALEGHSVTQLDVFAGARFWHQKLGLTLDVNGTLTGPLPGFEVSGDAAVSGTRQYNWVDPLIGLRLRHDFDTKNRLTLRADVGGFGVASDLSWQASAVYGFNLGQWRSIDFSGAVGYRALYVDYDEGTGLNAFKFDALHHGLLLGVAARF